MSTAQPGQREPLGAAVGRPPRRLGAERGPAAPDLRGGAASASGSSRAGACSTSAAASACSCAWSPSAAASRSGIDASEALIELARARLPDADLRVGEMEELPYDDDTFDLVTGFNSFFFANDMVAALREAGRVAKPGAPVVIQVWGAHERCDLEAMKEIARPFLPPRPPDAPPDPDLSEPGALEALATQAGLDAGERVRRQLGLRVPRRGDARPRARRRRRARHPRRPRARARAQERDRRRPRPLPHAPTAATGSRTSTTT